MANGSNIYEKDIIYAKWTGRICGRKIDLDQSYEAVNRHLSAESFVKMSDLIDQFESNKILRS